LPAASAKTKMPDAFTQTAYDLILKENNLKPAMFNLRKVRQAFFKAHLRPATIIPERLSFEFLDDEVYRGSKKLMLKFILPRASYATMLIKRIFSEPLLEQESSI
jgi:tRNA pseudouridine13 synthase